MATGECGAPSMSSRGLALFVNSNSLPTDFIKSSLLSAEERHLLKRYFIPEWRLPKFEADYFFDSTIFPVMQMPEEFSLNEFPDDLLVEVFRRAHQTDRIHSVSLVCRRWNRLLYTRGLWTSVRMKIETEEQFTAAKAFLKIEGISHSLVKLYLRYWTENFSENVFTPTVLPEKLPKLLHYHSTGEVMDGDSCFEFLNEVMPRLETLILNDNRVYFHSPDSTFADTSKCLFKKLRNFSTDSPTFRTFPWLQKIKELDIYCKLFGREAAKYSELQKLRLRHLETQFPPLFLQTLCISSKLVTLDISGLYRDPSRTSVSQLIAAVRNLHFLEHLHWFSLRTRFPVAGLFAPPERKFDFPSRLKYLFVVYSEPIVVEEITLNCPELRSLYLYANSFDHDSRSSESVFIQIAERLRNLEYLRVKLVRSSAASMLNALEEDALPCLRYLHREFVKDPQALWNQPFLEDDYRNEMVVAESLLSRRPNLTVVSGPLSSNTWVINGKDYKSLDWSLFYRLLGSEEGVCCVALYDLDF